MTEPQPERAVQDVMDALLDAWNRHDAVAFAGVFATDADFTNVFGMRASGRDAIEDFHAPIFATMFKDSTLRATSTRVRRLRSDIAMVDVHWEMIGARDPQGEPWPCRRGLMSLVVARNDGDWSIVVMHNMDLPDEARAEAQRTLRRPTA